MSEDGNILFVRQDGKDNDVNDAWDDSVLIKAYDKAVNLAKEQVAKRLSLETSSDHGKSNKLQSPKHQKQGNPLKKWIVGSPCRAIYSVDNEEYEAVISKIFESDSKTCIVKFVGYGNTEKVDLSSLRESDGLESQISQQRDADAMKNIESNSEPEDPHFSYKQSSRSNGENEKMDCETEIPKHSKSINLDYGSFTSSAFSMIPPAPPLPPQLMARLPNNDTEALSSMLMSWYMSGFHTGYYHGMKQAEKNSNRRKKC